jgi:aminopeptidase 2
VSILDLLVDAIAITSSRVIDELKCRFEKYVESKDQSHIPVDLIGATYRSVVRHGGAKAWNAMVDIYRKPSSPQIKLTAMWVSSDTPLFLGY